jgi:hypothetical protein
MTSAQGRTAVRPYNDLRDHWDHSLPVSRPRLLDGSTGIGTHQVCRSGSEGITITSSETSEIWRA